MGFDSAENEPSKVPSAATRGRLSGAAGESTADLGTPLDLPSPLPERAGEALVAQRRVRAVQRGDAIKEGLQGLLLNVSKECVGRVTYVKIESKIK